METRPSTFQRRLWRSASFAAFCSSVDGHGPSAGVLSTSEEVYFRVSEEDEFKRFLFDHVEDVQELSMLAWVESLAPNSGRSGNEISEGIHFPVGSTIDAAERLVARGLLARSETEPPLYYREENEEIRVMLSRAVAAYRSDPVRVMQLLTTNSIDRLRAAALQTFAECFRLGGPKPNG